MAQLVPNDRVVMVEEDEEEVTCAVASTEQQKDTDQRQRKRRQAQTSFLPGAGDWDHHDDADDEQEIEDTAGNFYDAAYAEGIPAAELHRAVVESHELRQRWWVSTQPEYRAEYEGNADEEDEWGVGLDFDEHDDHDDSPFCQQEESSRDHVSAKKRPATRDHGGSASHDADRSLAELNSLSRPGSSDAPNPKRRHKKSDRQETSQQECSINIIRTQPSQDSFLTDEGDGSQVSSITDESRFKQEQQHRDPPAGNDQDPVILMRPEPYVAARPGYGDHEDGSDQQQDYTPYGPARPPALVMDDVTESTEQVDSVPPVHPRTDDELEMIVTQAKQQLLQTLAIVEGDMDSPQVKEAMEPLFHFYKGWEWDARDPYGYNYQTTYQHVEGMWLTLSKPTYGGNLGTNGNGEPMYTLGRMSFDMFCPTQLVCSIQGTFNPVEQVTDPKVVESVPKSLQEDLEKGESILRTYNIVTAFTVEPYHPDLMQGKTCPNTNVRRPIKGIMTTFGYILPDPNEPNRLSIWFTGGTLEVNDDDRDVQEWMRLFSPEAPDSGRTFSEAARVLAAKFLLGAQVPTQMEEDGSLTFSFTKPIGGHGMAYVDVMYLDDSLRIVRGHKGTYYVFVRVPEH